MRLREVVLHRERIRFEIASVAEVNIEKVIEDVRTSHRRHLGIAVFWGRF